MAGSGPVLVSWVALNHDPYHWRWDKKEGYKRDKAGNRIPGPTLTLLFDKESPHRGQILDVVLLLRKASTPKDSSTDRRVAERTKAEIEKEGKGIKVDFRSAALDDPTDHKAIYGVLKTLLPELRRKFAGRELIIHVSPGTPAMQTVWVLMGETGFIDQPFELVKSVSEKDRKGGPAVVSFEVGIETYYRMYMESRPRRLASAEDTLQWNPQRFQSEKLQELYRLAARFAGLNVPVLIFGERGTGKTTLANWIRANSPFRKKGQDKRWPAVPCGQYSPSTMRAELFGYKKGAYTGADKDKDGLLRAAHKDTLFLDEVADMSRDLQRLLIKALEEKEYLPVGADEPVKSEFRLVTATNRPWSDLEERLEPDFLDRISMVTLQLPPLREIRDDIPWLWRSVYEKAGTRAGVGKGARALAQRQHDKVVAALRQHPLPGNIRDLLRVAYRLLAAKVDTSNPVSDDDAIASALQGLIRGDPVEEDDLARALARAFADSKPIDSLLAPGQELPVKNVHKALQRYVALEARRVAKARKVGVEQLTDVGERTLRNWLGE